jgi:hypothetical protein
VESGHSPTYQVRIQLDWGIPMRHVIAALIFSGGPALPPPEFIRQKSSSALAS